MIEKLQAKFGTGLTYADREILDKINEIIGHLNEQKYLEKEAIADRKLSLETEKMFIDMASKRESKWKVGDKVWFINLGIKTNDWEVDDCILNTDAIRDIDTNYFKTRESAEAALAEIQQIMEKYE